MSITNNFIPTTNTSSLVYGKYKGFPLLNGKAYRPTSLEKISSILAMALEDQSSCYDVEIYHDVDGFSNKLKQTDPDATYLKVNLNSHVRVLVFTKKSEDEVTAFIDSISDDYNFYSVIKNVAEETVQTAKIAYSYAEHYLIPKPSRKFKQFSGSDLTAEEKDKSIVFELQPKIVVS